MVYALKATSSPINLLSPNHSLRGRSEPSELGALLIYLEEIEEKIEALELFRAKLQARIRSYS